MLIPPWIIDELEEERRRDEERRPALELPLEEALEPEPASTPKGSDRGVVILDISPTAPNSYPI